jgi:hypothetical protein
MNAILLQHWSEIDLPEIVRLSSANMEAYAKRMGADYQLFHGFPFDERLTAPCQKLHCLSEKWDEYDVVVMVDADMFAVKGLEESIFEVQGMGIYHPSAHKRVLGKVPELTCSEGPFWGGAVYRFPQFVRKLLRENYDYDEAKQFNNRGCGEDEGILHRLARRAGFRADLPRYFSQDWARGHFDDLTNAKLVHVRHHDGKGNRVDKIDVYRELEARGIL